MSPHRWTAPIPADPTPLDLAAAGRPSKAAWMVAVGGFAVALGIEVGLIANDSTPAQATPTRAASLVAFPIERIDAQRLAEIRVEAFRAGYATAIEQGCAQSLSSPIAR